jgi:hypothetical protein
MRKKVNPFSENWRKMEDIKLTAHVKLSEACKTSTGLNNEPNEEQINNLKLVCENVFEKARNHFGYPIAITSGFRSKEVNKAVGGVSNSQHLEGKAIDADADTYGKLTNIELFNWIKDNCEFDQLILEGKGGKWVHFSWNEGKNRNQVLNIPNPH